MGETDKREIPPEMLDKVFRRIGEPGKVILKVLNVGEFVPGIEIIRRVELVLNPDKKPGEEGYQRLDPSTCHYALKNLEKEGLVIHQDNVEVEVPGLRGTTQIQPRPVYSVIGTGIKALTDIDLMGVKPSLRLKPDLSS